MSGFSSENLEISSENDSFCCFRLKKDQTSFAHVAEHVLRRKDGVPAQIAQICQKGAGLEHFCVNGAIWLDWPVKYMKFPVDSE